MSEKYIFIYYIYIYIYIFFRLNFFLEKKTKTFFFLVENIFFLKFVHEEKLNSPDQKTFINLFFFHSLKKSIENILFLLDSIHDEKKSSL